MLRSRVLPVNLKRTALIVIVCGAVAAWFSAAMTPSWRQPASEPLPQAPVDKSGAALAAEIERLHAQLRPDATPSEQVRNLFTFHAPSHSAAASLKHEEAPPVPVAAPAVPPPSLRLAGLAEDAGPDGPLRTAVVSGGGQVFLVREGGTLSVGDQRFTVSTITEDSVSLIDTANGETRTLTLK